MGTLLPTLPSFQNILEVVDASPELCLNANIVITPPPSSSNTAMISHVFIPAWQIGQCSCMGATLVHATAWPNFCLGCGFAKKNVRYRTQNAMNGPPHGPILLIAPLLVCTPSPNVTGHSGGDVGGGGSGGEQQRVIEWATQQPTINGGLQGQRWRPQQRLP